MFAWLPWRSYRASETAKRRRARLGLEVLESRVVPSTMTVNDPLDDYLPSLSNHFVNPANGELSLRGALLAANAKQGSAITFSVANVTVSGTYGSLPTLDVPVSMVGNGVTIEGGAGTGIMFGAAGNSVTGLAINGFTSTQLVFLAGRNTIADNDVGTNDTGTTAVGGGAGIAVTGSGNTIQNNVISGLQGLALRVAGSANTIQGNDIGVDIHGTTALGDGSGIAIVGSANTIGGTTEALANVIAGLDGFNGVGIAITNGSNNLVEGNRIGTDLAGTTLIGNVSDTPAFGSYDGISIAGGGHNTIGGTTAGAGNVIAGNDGDGILLTAASGGAASVGNRIKGNRIGTDISGSDSGFGNGGNGIDIAGSSFNTIGGTTALAANVISDNGTNDASTTGTDGVLLTAKAAGNVIAGNAIGTDAAGNAGLGNAGLGVSLTDGAAHNTIDGASAGAGNVISDNGSGGISIAGTGTLDNLVAGNRIGTDSTGSVALGNGLSNAGSGVLIAAGANDNTIGGTSTAAGNVIAANAGDGVDIVGSGATVTTGNVVAGNDIGTASNGTTALANAGSGVVLDGGASNARVTKNRIGGSTSGAGNLIAGNTQDGIELLGAATTANLIAGNWIGTDKTGATALANGGNGVVLAAGASHNTVGGSSTTAENVISGNTEDGVLIAGAGTSQNIVSHDLIGLTSAGTAGLGNGANGVAITAGASSNTIGGTTAAARNVIAGNTLDGVAISSTSSPSASNRIEANYLGTNAAGSAALANGGYGVGLEQDANNNIVGGPGAARNVISGNALGGVVLEDGATGNRLVGNFIGTNAAGTGGVANQGDGVDIGLGNAAASGNTIGGAGAANRIAYNTNVGIDIVAGNGDLVSRNTIYANGSAGIHLGTGANNSIAAPSLTTASYRGGQLTLQGTIAGSDDATLTLEIFANPASPGEGQTFLGTVTIQTDANGNFTAKLPTSLAAGLYITATVTDSSNDTSAFSNTAKA